MDSRGRRIEPSAERQREDLGRIYDLEDKEDKEEAGGAAAAAKGPRRGPPGNKHKMARMEAKLEQLDRLARGEVQAEDSSDDTDSEVEAAELDEGVDVDEELREDVERGPSTRRLAAVNCDWDNMRAIDLLALFQSFNSAAGAVQRVTVYPSDFGLEHMVRGCMPCLRGGVNG